MCYRNDTNTYLKHSVINVWWVSSAQFMSNYRLPHPSTTSLLHYSITQTHLPVRWSQSADALMSSPFWRYISLFHWFIESFLSQRLNMAVWELLGVESARAKHSAQTGKCWLTYTDWSVFFLFTWLNKQAWR